MVKFISFCFYDNGDGCGRATVLGNFQCWGVMLMWIILGQGPSVLAVNANRGYLDIFSLISLFLLLLSGRRFDRLKYCLREPLNPK